MFSKYDIDIKKYKSLFPYYLQNPGSYAMNETKLYYDIMNNYKNQIIEFWKMLDTDTLERNYMEALRNNPSLNDADYKYTYIIENLCKTYDIIREHNVGKLTNKHLIRLLKLKTAGINYDGTKEKLEEILNNIFENMNFLFLTDNMSHARAKVYLIKPEDNLLFDDIDKDLFESGYYFLEILGIELEFGVIDAETLVYDYTRYADEPSDPDTKYDKGGN